MQYLLIGNGEVDSMALEEAVSRADIIAQVNKCRYFDATINHPTSFIFITNTGREAPDIVERLLSLRDRPELRHTIIIPVRNPSYYWLKMWLLRIRRRYFAKYFQTDDTWLMLTSLWDVVFVSFFATLRLDLTMVRLGMPRSWMPSTGLIAFRVLRKQLRKTDSLDVYGFTFKGWELHPWDVERKLVRSVAGVENA